MEGKDFAMEAKAIKKDLQLSVKSKDALLKALKVHTKSTRALSQLSISPVLAKLTTTRDSKQTNLHSMKLKCSPPMATLRESAGGSMKTVDSRKFAGNFMTLRLPVTIKRVCRRCSLGI